MRINQLLAVGVLVLGGVLAGLLYQAGVRSGPLVFTSEMSLKEVGTKNSIPIKKVLHVMSHEDSSVWDLPRDKPIAELGIEPEFVLHSLEHVAADAAPIWVTVKYAGWVVLMIAAVLLVLTRKEIRRLRVPILVGVVLIFGVVLGDSPNPMEGVVKFGKMLNNMEANPRAVILATVLFSLLSLWGCKLLCSWGCQLGALQESLYNLPVLRKVNKRIKLPFWLTLPIRVILFAVFLMYLFGIVVETRNFVTYHHVNFFKVYRPSDFADVALYGLPVLLLLSLFVYRPFCHLICPFGLYAWVLENLAINRIRIDRDRCIDCSACVKACPTTAMKTIYEAGRNRLAPDCWSCGQCIESCPVNAVIYGKNPALPPPGQEGKESSAEADVQQ